MMTNRFNQQMQKYAAQRRFTRDECRLDTSITRGSELRIPGRVVDISRGGCSVRAQVNFAKGDRIRILLPTMGDEEAIVVWALIGVFGCEFSTPIDARDYPKLLAAMKLSAGDDQDRPQQAKSNVD